MRDMSQEYVEQFWTHELGAGSGLVSVTPQMGCAAQTLYHGVQMFRRGDRLIVAAPARYAEFIAGALHGRSVDECFSSAWLQATLGDDAERVLGPAEVHYADESSFRGTAGHDARSLSDADGVAYQALAAAMNSKEIEGSGLSPDNFPAFGAFSGDTLCAAASYRICQPSIAHIVVASHPKYRRQGFARAAVSALAAAALKSHLVLQWRALVSNSESLKLARALGFDHYCSTLFAPLREPR